MLTVVAWFTLAQATWGGVVAVVETPPAAPDDATSEPHPVSAANASTIPSIPRSPTRRRAERGSIMRVGRTPRVFRSIASARGAQNTPTATAMPTAVSMTLAISSLRSPALAPRPPAQFQARQRHYHADRPEHRRSQRQPGVIRAEGEAGREVVDTQRE